MKLIDLLLRELPERGGWPDGADWCVYHDIDEEVSFGYRLSPLLIDGTWTTTENDSHWLCRGDFYHKNSNDFNAEIVTRDQYQSALAASQKVEWSGAGLPQVGCECECHVDEGVIHCVVVGYDFDGKAVVMRNVTARKYFSIQANSGRIKPLRSEDDKKRDEAIEAIASYALPYKCGADIYDAIAAGKIPGVKLED